MTMLSEILANADQHYRDEKLDDMKSFTEVFIDIKAIVSFCNRVDRALLSLADILNIGCGQLSLSLKAKLNQKVLT